MTIGVFTIMLHSGGTERVIANLSRIWSALGHRVIFFTQRQPHAYEFEHACVARVCAEHGVWSDYDARVLQEEHKLDLVVFNGGWNSDGVEPLVRRFHDLHVKTMTLLHHAFDNWLFSGANAGDYAKETLLPHLDYLVCVDKMQSLWWSHRHPCVFCVPNPVSLSIARAAARPYDPHAMVWVGRADDWGKRAELALEVLARVRKEIPDATLTIVGSLPSRAKLKAPGLRCTGYVAEPSKIVMTASVNLFTSLWEVTVPQVVLEAGSVGVPTVAFDLPVLRDEPGVYLGRTVEDVVQQIVGLMSRKTCDGTIRSGMEERHRAILSRNDLVRGLWQEIFSALEAGQIDAIRDRHVAAYFQLPVYCRLIEEVQRAEGHFVRTQYAALQKLNGWKARIKRIKGLLGL